MTRRALQVGLAAAIALCTFSQSAASQPGAAHIAAVKRFEAMPYYKFCTTFGRLAAGTSPEADAARAVASGRYMIRSKWIPNITQKTLDVGMPMCAVVAIFGEPSELREVGTPLGKGWTVWYRAPRRVLIYLDSNQNVIQYSY